MAKVKAKKAKKTAKAVKITTTDKAVRTAKTEVVGKAKKVKFQSRLVPYENISEAAKETVSKLDNNEVKIADLNEERQGLLGKLYNDLPSHSASFVHPDKGPVSVMCRKGVWFSRSKPSGKDAAE